MSVPVGKFPLKIGDRVWCCVQKDSENEICRDEKGTVIYIYGDEDRRYQHVGVEWDLSHSNRHTLSRKCKPNRGWWVSYHEIQLDNDNVQLELF